MDSRTVGMHPETPPDHGFFAIPFRTNPFGFVIRLYSHRTVPEISDQCLPVIVFRETHIAALDILNRLGNLVCRVGIQMDVPPLRNSCTSYRLTGKTSPIADSYI